MEKEMYNILPCDEVIKQHKESLDLKVVEENEKKSKLEEIVNDYIGSDKFNKLIQEINKQLQIHIDKKKSYEWIDVALNPDYLYNEQYKDNWSYMLRVGVLHNKIDHIDEILYIEQYNKLKEYLEAKGYCCSRNVGSGIWATKNDDIEQRQNSDNVGRYRTYEMEIKIGWNGSVDEYGVRKKR